MEAMAKSIRGKKLVGNRGRLPDWRAGAPGESNKRF
jgi:hypothetical protein